MTVRSIAQEVQLEPAGDSRWARAIGEGWVNSGDRVFGGYSAALALAAAVEGSPHDALASGTVMFLEAILPGRIEFEVTTLRRGRSVACMSVIGVQHGRPAITAQAWTRRAAPMATPSGGVVAPEGVGVSLEWLDSVFPFHQYLESRALRYPASLSEFETGAPWSVELWARPRGSLPVEPLHDQLFDVILADAHLGDIGVASVEDLDLLISLDLQVQWATAPCVPGWRHIVVAEAPAESRMFPSVARISDTAGTLSAVVTQQVYLASRPGPGATPERFAGARSSHA